MRLIVILRLCPYTTFDLLAHPRRVLSLLSPISEPFVHLLDLRAGRIVIYPNHAPTLLSHTVLVGGIFAGHEVSCVIESWRRFSYTCILELWLRNTQSTSWFSDCYTPRPPMASDRLSMPVRRTRTKIHEVIGESVPPLMFGSSTLVFHCQQWLYRLLPRSSDFRVRTLLVLRFVVAHPLVRLSKNIPTLRYT